MIVEISDRNVKNRLLRSAEQMIQSFTLSLHAKRPSDEGIHYFSCLLNLRECRLDLESVSRFQGELVTKYEMIHARLEKLCEKAAEAEGGQYRMLG